MYQVALVNLCNHYLRTIVARYLLSITNTIQYNTDTSQYMDNLITVSTFNYKTNLNSLKISMV